MIGETSLPISGFEPWHFHVYFTAETRAKAEALIEQANNMFNIDVGHFHDKPVGPHPVGSCQLTVIDAVFGPLLNWLALNRNGLTIFCHANTGDVMKDHTDHTIWLGSMPALRLDVLERLLARG